MKTDEWRIGNSSVPRVTFNDKNEVASQDLDTGAFTVTYSQLGEKINQSRQTPGLKVHFGEKSFLEQTTLLESNLQDSPYKDVYSEKTCNRYGDKSMIFGNLWKRIQNFETSKSGRLSYLRPL